jgi:hypothetical protein
MCVVQARVELAQKSFFRIGVSIAVGRFILARLMGLAVASQLLQHDDAPDAALT